jgi:CBS domain-containing protein
MKRDVFIVREDQSVEELIDLMVQEHIHGCPVVDRDAKLVGVVTQQDVFFSRATQGRARGEAAGTRARQLKVRDVMTSPAVSAEEETEIVSLCRMMHKLRIHRIPIVSDGKVIGIISSLDILGQLAKDPADL